MSEHEVAVFQKRLGGHALAAIACVHPHMKPIDVYEQLVNDYQQETSDAMRWGSKIEPILLEWAAEVLGVTYTPGSPYPHPDIPWLRSHPDGRIGTDAFFSAKGVGKWRAKWWGSSKTDLVPEYTNMQEQAYMGIERREVSHVVATIAGNPPELWSVPFAPRIFELALELGDNFLRRHIIPKVPPPPDGSERYTRWIKEKLQQTRGELVHVGAQDELYAVAREYQRQRQELANAKSAMEKNEQTIKLAIGERAGMELADTSEVIGFREIKKKTKDGKPIRMFSVPPGWRTAEEE